MLSHLLTVKPHLRITRFPGETIILRGSKTNVRTHFCCRTLFFLIGRTETPFFHAVLDCHVSRVCNISNLDVFIALKGATKTSMGA